jgi:cullin-associated NEDD8-dissociated protein 1
MTLTRSIRKSRPRNSSSSTRKKIAIGISIFLIIIGISLGLAYGLFLQNNISQSQPNQDPEMDHVIEMMNIGEEAMSLSQGSRYRIEKSKSGQLLLIYKDNKNLISRHDIPAARSFDGGDWEPLFPVLLQSESCNENTCTFRVPVDGNYSIVQPNLRARSWEARISDFLIQATFGPKNDLINSFPNDTSMFKSARAFIQNQMQIPATFHREYYRSRANVLIPFNGSTQMPVIGPCEVGSRWHRAALDVYDSDGVMSILNDSLLYINGEYRTKVPAAFVNSLKASGNGTWRLCPLSNSQAKPGSSISFKIGNSACTYKVTHPLIDFSDQIPDQSRIAHVNRKFVPLRLGTDGIGLLADENPNCDVSSAHRNLFACDNNGIWYRYHSRVRLFNNSFYSLRSVPNLSAPKTFLNEDNCFPQRLQAPIQFRSAIFNLTHANLQKFYELSNVYAYFVTGLQTNVGPCISQVARFLRESKTCTNPVNMTADVQVLKSFIEASDSGRIVVDINANKDSRCIGLKAGIEIQVENTCWTHVHEDLYSVFDFSSWIKKHPGGQQAIKQFSQSGTFQLIFPHVDEMFKWNTNRDELPFLGVLGSAVDFLDLPSEVQQFEIAQYLGAVTPKSLEVSYSENCGSFGEIENNPAFGSPFVFQIDIDYTAPFDGLTTDSKVNVWTNIALFASDQLRQRVAWALSQIFVINVDGLALYNEHEAWVNYYDIFVRNAFTNYLNVIKEVSFSPMMGYMLTFQSGKSYQQNFELSGLGRFPDENYAREIMQLFSIGLWKLNDNGTRIRDASGNVLETYSNLDIQDLARIWTGFRVHPFRKNIELTVKKVNMIDAMTISGSDHDTFPKQGLDGFHIGDRYPLCSSLPKLSYLRKGAIYRYLRSISSYTFHEKSGILTINESFSSLYRVLCNPNSQRGCQLRSKITLTSTLPCYGLECDIDSVKIVKFSINGSNIFYEYAQIPCVRLEFPQIRRVTTSTSSNRAICSDAKSIVASSACCSSLSAAATVRTRYFGEVQSFESARSVCAKFNQTLCRYSSLSVPSSSGGYRTWTSDSCKVRAQIFSDGRISIIHAFPSNWNIPNVYGLRADSNIKIRVNWESKLFPITGNCPLGCENNRTSCICDTEVENVVVFDNVSSIPSVEEVIAKLSIGAPNPAMFDLDTYKLAFNSASTGMSIFVTKVGVFDESTIFVVQLQGGRVQYLANFVSKVRVGLGSQFKFRNPPNFMLHEERNFRDAQYEVDALLEHLLYHQNTAPFVADLMIKRLVTSNPSPNYINFVVQAFKSGRFDTFGSGKYGDLAATVAAVLLYKDSLSATVKFDYSYGKFHEPLLKVMHFMRALNIYVKNNDEIYIRNLDSFLGQEPYNAPSVFNFYQSEFQTSGGVENAGLYSPEGQILTLPTIIRFLNGMLNLVEAGMISCYNTFGVSLSSSNCAQIKSGQSDPNNSNSAYLNYSILFGGLNGRDIIERLDILLTGGRTERTRKTMILNAYDLIWRNSSQKEALKNVIELFATVPEFQIFGVMPVFKIEPPQASRGISVYDASQYKAVVYIFLNGGMDSYNLIVPHSECSGIDLYEQYEDIRTDAAVPKNSLRVIRTPSWGTVQPCKVFGVHPSMPFLAQLYNSSEAAFISNIGTLVEPMTKTEYLSAAKKRPIGLFAHNVQQSIIRRVDADSISAKGVLGRISDYFSSRRQSVASYSVTGSFSPVLEGAIGASESQVIVDPRFGIATLDKDDLNIRLKQNVLNLTKNTGPSIFGDTWNQLLYNGVEKSSYLDNILDSATIPTSFAGIGSSIANQVQYVAKIISKRSTLKTTVDLFNVEMGGFDTHFSFSAFGDNMGKLDATLRAFVTEMKRQGIWKQVTIVVASDFARTLGSNGKGTDHAWAGNTFFLGGSVKGGQILGKYPSNLAESGDVNIGNGRMLPTNPWESLWNGVCQWMGIERAEALNTILPKRKNFVNGNHLFTKEVMFKE